MKSRIANAFAYSLGTQALQSVAVSLIVFLEAGSNLLRGEDLNLRPLGYEPVGDCLNVL